MKKLVAILVMLFYLPALGGIIVNTDFCCGRVSSIKVKLSEKANVHHFANDGCCGQSIVSLSIHSPQHSAPQQILSATPQVHTPAVFVPTTMIPHWAFVGNKNTSPHIYSPPNKSSVPLYLRNEVFRI